MKKYKIGYTQGVYDMFHIGHLNLLNKAKMQCEYLVVGVNSDRLVKEYKHKMTVVNEKDRSEIVRNIKAVDECVIVDTLDKVETMRTIHFDAVFIGSDWYGNTRWTETKSILSEYGVDVVFLPHTEGISSTELRSKTDLTVDEKI